MFTAPPIYSAHYLLHILYSFFPLFTLPPFFILPLFTMPSIYSAPYLLHIIFTLPLFYSTPRMNFIPHYSLYTRTPPPIFSAPYLLCPLLTPPLYSFCPLFTSPHIYSTPFFSTSLFTASAIIHFPPYIHVLHPPYSLHLLFTPAVVSHLACEDFILPTVVSVYFSLFFKVLNDFFPNYFIVSCFLLIK